jgi:hypothetical protein
MAKEFYVRTIQAGRYFKSVRYQRALPHDSVETRSAKSAATSRAQRYINLKNAAEKLQMLLCANFDDPASCFCTFTFSEDNLPANRKMTRQLFTGFISSLRRSRQRAGKPLIYIYNVEGTSLASDPAALEPDNIRWEVKPWEVKTSWSLIDKKTAQKKEGIRFHIHAFLILPKKDREAIKRKWVYGQVYINPIKVSLPDTFYRLSYYVTKESRSRSIPAGSRSYVPSRNLQQPVVEGHWCDAHEVFLPPANAEDVKTACETTEYSSFQYISYRLPRAKKHTKSYKSKGRLK